MTTLYLITDRRLLGSDPSSRERLVQFAADAAAAGIDLIQIRERDLGVRDLLGLARAVVAATGSTARVLVNDRADVALAAGAAGVHLTTTSIPVRAVRKAFGRSLLVGVSTHSAAEAREAGAEGADFVVCGPVFPTPSKAGLGPPLGPDGLRCAVRASRAPVYALGGVTTGLFSVARETGAAGIAGIRLFHEAWIETGRDGLEALVRHARDIWEAKLS